ncbi:MAG: DUF4142 domain-containing protein [Alphaproteobacteria bacterium]|nr:DUF4142 domain-containing protein [Alphaproteobacteria bacterium]
MRGAEEGLGEREDGVGADPELVGGARRGQHAHRAEAATTREAGEFVQSAAICNVYEIESGRIALDRTRNPKVREAAQAMIDDYTDNSARLETAVRQSPKVDTSHIPPGLDRRRETVLDHLREAPEDEFNRTYLAQQVMAHAEAASLMHMYRDEGDCLVLRSFAAEASPVIERHLEHVKRLKTDMPR